MTVEYALHDTLIHIQNLGLRFGEQPVLTDINAEVKDIVRPGCVTGQVIGILGPSGVGKTLLSRLLTGLQEPTTGSITVGPDRQPIRAGLVGFVAQSYPLLRHRTVLDNLLVAARAHHAKTAVERAGEIITQFGLTGMENRYPAELSGGQRQRAAIAQQLLCSEHYLVLDEPTTGLDLIMKDRVVDLIRDVAKLSEENTIFIVSHDIPAVASVADQLWLLGRTHDAEGNFLGSSIVQQYNLIERGVAWDPHNSRLPAFTELLHEIRARFEGLLLPDTKRVA